MQENLTALVESAGIVGAGGAGFPTHVKLNAKADTVIINGAECEPLLRVDQQLMARQAGRLLAALDKIVAHLGAREGVVALKEHYHTAAGALQQELAGYPKLRLHLLGAFYPAGDEQVIVYEVTGKVVPEGGIPIHAGVVVINVETALNVLDAMDGHPVTEKYLTLTGAVRTPKTVRVPLGITVAEALELAGGPSVADYRVVNGGPMMGRLVPLESVITKTTKGLLGHRIQPHKLMRLAAYGSMCDPAQTPMNAYLCCGCRLCEYACVMGLQPWKLNGSLKGILGEQGIRNSLDNKPEHGAPFREYKRYPVHKLIHQLGLSAYDVDAPMEEGALPSYGKVTLPLRQNVGASAEPVVEVGSRVEKGSLIARIPKDKLGANLHASISGTVAAISSDTIVVQA